MINEFHTLNGVCASLVPSGPGYENVSLANQVCTVVGSVPGQPTVDGNTFASLSFGYSYSNLWRVSHANIYISHGADGEILIETCIELWHHVCVLHRFRRGAPALDGDTQFVRRRELSYALQARVALDGCGCG